MPFSLAHVQLRLPHIQRHFKQRSSIEAELHPRVAAGWRGEYKHRGSSSEREREGGSEIPDLGLKTPAAATPAVGCRRVNVELIKLVPRVLFPRTSSALWQTRD